MKITKVSYSALLNLGNYSNERITFLATLNDGEKPEEVLEALREKVRAVGGQNADELYRKMREGRYQLTELEQKVEKAKSEWNATAEFLRTQGIKPDAPNMPTFTNLLPEVKLENSEISEGEIEDEDDEDDEDEDNEY